jgi:hypothetical protein
VIAEVDAVSADAVRRSSRPLHTAHALLFAAALVGAALALPSAASAQCAEPGAQLQVLVKGKTAIRRGPGLNYPVSAFIEDGRCMKANDISMDGNWVMIEDPSSKAIGWVPTKQLSPSSIELLAANRPSKNKGPVGSGQERGFVSTLRPVSLLVEPRRGAKERRLVPGAARLLALAITADKAWVQVRNERNETGWLATTDLEDTSDTIASLPVADGGLTTGVDTPITPAETVEPSGATITPSETNAVDPPRRRDERRDDAGVLAPPPPAGVLGGAPSGGFELQVLGVLGLPQHGLESDGARGLRRYALRANAGGALVELRVADVGPLALRAMYAIELLGGLATAEDADDTVGGQQHDIRLLAGLPLQLGPIALVPELGYAGQIYAMTPALASRDEPTFFSRHTHTAAIGARVGVDFAEVVRAELDGHGQVGFSVPYPFNLGQAGLTTGWRFGAAVRWAASPTFGLVLRAELRDLRAPFSGAAGIDPTITTAALVHAERHLAVGVSLRF